MDEEIKTKVKNTYKKPVEKNYPLSEKYKFRAKWRDEQHGAIIWVCGYLTWTEVNPSPVGYNPNRDYNYYKIVSRDTGFTPDWNMPFQKKTHYIPSEFNDTITQFSGWKDQKGEDIYNEDVLRFYGEDGLYWDCWMTEYGILQPCSTEFENMVNFAFINPSTREVKDCEVIGNRWDGPKPGYEFQDWIVWNSEDKAKYNVEDKGEN